MNENQYIQTIETYLERVDLLRNQSDFDQIKVDEVLEDILGLTLDLHEFYEKKIRELNENPQKDRAQYNEILELSKRREKIIPTFFNASDPDHKKIIDLFKEIYEQSRYETTKYKEERRNLIKAQIKQFKVLNGEIRNLKIEELEIQEKIDNHKNRLISFEDFNNKLNEEYEEIINSVKKDYGKIINGKENVDISKLEKNLRQVRNIGLEFKENLRLAKTASGKVNINLIENRVQGNEEQLQDLSTKLVIWELNNKGILKKEVTTYKDLKNKMEEMYLYTSNLEKENKTDPFYSIEIKNNIGEIEKQINKEKINELESSLKNIKKKIEEKYEEMQNLDAISIFDKLGNMTQVVGQGIGKFYEKSKNYIIEKRQSSSILKEKLSNKKLELLEGLKKHIEDLIDKENNKTKDTKDVSKEDIDTLNKNELSNIKSEEKNEVISKEKSGSGLLQKIKNNKGEIAAILLAITITVTTIASGIVYAINKNNIYPNPTNVPAVSQEYEKVYYPTIGDKVEVEEGVKYYSNPTNAYNEQNGYKVGDVIKEGNYYINVIALVDKNTGEVLASETYSGVNAKTMADSLGIPEGSYEVYANVSTKEGGNIGWVKAKDLIFLPNENIKEEGGKSR